jgi:hypothetical protein
MEKKLLISDIENKENLNEAVWFLVLAAAGLIVGGATISYQMLTKSNYRQKMKEHNGFFDKIKLGEFFDVEKFTGDEDARTAMNINYLTKVNNSATLKKDDFGYYLLLSKDSVRIYLPKKEWFSQFQGSVKSFWDTQSESSEKINKFSLVFYLKFPQKSIGGRQPDGEGGFVYGPIDNSDISRGWAVLSNYKTSGYFSVEGNKIYKGLTSKTNVSENFEENSKNKIISESSEFFVNEDLERFGIKGATNPNVTPRNYEPTEEDLTAKELEKYQNLTLNPPSGLYEYSWYQYGSDYNKSDLDVWYDSSYGTAIVIGTQLCGAIIFSELGGLAFLSFETETALVIRELAKYSIIIGGEVIVGLPEVIYLYDRGMTEIAAIVAICMLLPLATESMLPVKLFNLKTLDEYVWLDLAKQSKEWKSPLQFKRWVQGLDKVTREAFMDRFAVIVSYYSKNSTKTIAEELSKQLLKIVKQIKKGRSLEKGTPFRKQFKRLFKQEFQKILENVPPINLNRYPLLFNLGFSVGMVGTLMIGSILFIENDEKKLNDRQGILDGAEKTIKYLSNKNWAPSKMMNDKLTEMATEINKLTQDENISPDNLKQALRLNYQVFLILENLNTFYNNGNYNGWSQKNFAKLYQQQSNNAYKLLLEFQNISVNNLLQKLQQATEKNAKNQVIKDLDTLIDPETINKIDKLYNEQEIFGLVESSCPKIINSSFVDKFGKSWNYEKARVDRFVNWASKIQLSGQSITQNFEDSWLKKNNKKINYQCYKIKINKESNEPYYDKNELTNRIISFGQETFDFLNKEFFSKYPHTNFSDPMGIYNHALIRSLCYNFFDDYLDVTAYAKKNT